MSEGTTETNGAKEPPNKKMKQQHMDGMDPKGKLPKEVRDAAFDYVEKRDNRMSWGKLETEAKKVLKAACLKHGVTEYADDDIEITTTTPEPEVKVRDLRDPKEEEAS
jgi:hypothetical protein